MGSRTWFKVFSDKWLDGTIREEKPEVRGIWIDLLALASSGRYGDLGHVKLAKNLGFTDQQICTILNVEGNVWWDARNRLLETDRIKIDTSTNIIYITNWGKYQSEYNRQKKYRKKLQPKVTPKSNEENRRRKRKRTNIHDGNFDVFWSCFPKKVNKEEARVEWSKLSPDHALCKEIMNGLRKACTSQQWRKDGGQFILSPNKWLKNRRWEDETGEGSDDRPRINFKNISEEKMV